MTIGPFGDLGTQVFLYDPDSDSFTDLTAQGPGPGFGDPLNKYSWGSTFFDGNGDDVDELYVGTLSFQLDPVGTTMAALRIQAFLDTEDVTLDLDDTDTLRDLVSRDFPNIFHSDGGEIWRYDFVEAQAWQPAWTQVAGPDMQAFLDDEDGGIREMARFDGKVFAAVTGDWGFDFGSTGENPPKLIWSEDGDNWNRITDGPVTPDTTNSTIRSMDVVTDGDGNEVLLVGTGNGDGGELWTYDTSGSWTQLGTVPALAHSETITFDGDIYIGTWFPYGFYQLDLSGPTAELINLTPQNLGPIEDSGVMQLVEFNGEFYIGGLDFGNGASLIRTETPMDPNSWELLTNDGFQTDGDGNELLDDEMAALGVDQSIYTWSMAVVDGDLYIGDFNGERTLLIRTTDGESFEIVNDDQELGSRAYGIRRFEPFFDDGSGLPDTTQDANRLILATADPLYDPVPLALLPNDAIIGPNLGGGTIWGTPGEDAIFGGGGADEILAVGEDDWVFGDLGTPLIFAGNDTIEGGDGQDHLYGNLGDDSIEGGADQDLLVGGLGRDLLRGGSEIDLLVGDLTLDGKLLEILGGLGDLGALPLGGLPLPGGNGGGGGQLLSGVPGETGALMEASPGGLGLGLTVPGLPPGLPGGLPGLPGDVSLIGDPLSEGEIAGAFAGQLAELLPAIQTVFTGVFGTGAAGTFKGLADWSAQQLAGGDEDISAYLPGASFDIDGEFQGALETLLGPLDQAIAGSGTDLPTVLSGLGQMAMQWENGQAMSVPPALMAWLSDAHDTVMDWLEGFTDPPGNGQPPPVIKGQPPTLGNGPKGELPELEMTPPLGGPMPVLPVLPPPMLATFPGEALDALETLAAEADAAARAEFDQGFLAAIKDLSGLFADTIEGQEGSDIGFGNAGSDVMRGGEGRELFYGGTGFDTAEGGEGDDIFYGGDGNDWFVGGPGDDWYRGGLGSGDTAQFPLPLEAYEVETDEDGLLIKRFGDAEDDDAEADEDGPAVEIDILDNDGIAETDFVWSDVETFVFSGDGASSAEVNAQVGVAPSLSAPGFVSFDFSQTEGLVSVLNGVVSYDPNGQFEDLEAGETAEDSFQYTLNDGRGGGDTATVTITITGADEEEEPEPEPEAEPGPPRLVARNDLAFTDEDSAVTINVLGNDRGGDEPIVVTGVGDSQMGAELSVNPDGTIDYTPPPVANGLAAGDTDKDFFTYTVADSAGQTATATVLVELEGRNDAPRATNVGTNTPLGQSVIVGGFFADPDQGDTVSVGAVPPISELGATLRFVGDALFYDPGTLDTVPEPGGTLIDRFDYLVRDQSGASDFGTATVQVINRQDGEAPAPMTMGDEGDNAFALSAVAMPGTLDAGGGEDTVRLPGALSEYGFEPIEGGHRAVRGEAGEGTDLLGVERILLDDARIVAEDDPALATISFFYRLTYGRDADIAGLSHWYGAHEDGMGLGAIADAFAEAPEFTEVFGPDVESEDFIAALYDRGLQRRPDDKGSAHWSAALDSGEADWGDMLEAFAASEEMAELYANDVDDGILVLV